MPALEHNLNAVNRRFQTQHVGLLMEVPQEGVLPLSNRAGSTEVLSGSSRSVEFPPYRKFAVPSPSYIFNRLQVYMNFPGRKSHKL